MPSITPRSWTACPSITWGAIRELTEYDFMDPEARRMFQELLDMLRSQMAQNISWDMMQRLGDITPEDMAAMREMLHQLNQMLRDKTLGRAPDFDGFMERFVPLFGPNSPQNLEELMERLMEQMAQAQSLLESMSPEARRQLQEALNSVPNPDIERELAQLASWMEGLMPLEDIRREYPFLGAESLTMDQVMQLMGDLQQMDDLEGAIQ